MTQIEQRAIPTEDGDDAVEIRPPAGWRSRIDGNLACMLGFTWFVGYFVAGLLEPTPSDPAVMHTWYVQAINGVLLASLAVMIVGLVMLRRVGVFASLAATTALATAVVACPITGHHAFGLWWFGELACVAAIAAVTGVALHHTRS